MGSYCAAINCHNSRGNCTLSMFRFPKDEERCKKWVQHVRREDLTHTPLNKLCHFQLCSNHFEDSQFMHRNTKSKLIWNAVPTLFDVPNPPAKITPSWPLTKRLFVNKKASVNLKSKTLANQPTTSNATNECDTPRKKNLRRKVQTLRTKLWQKDKKKKLKFQAEIDSVVLQLKNICHKILSISLKGKLSYSIQQKKVKDMQHQIKCWPSQYFIKVGKHIDYSQSCLHFHQKEQYRNICKILTLCLDSMMEFLMH